MPDDISNYGLWALFICVIGLVLLKLFRVSPPPPPSEYISPPIRRATQPPPAISAEDQTPFARLTKRKKLNIALENSWAITLRYVDRDETETTRKVLPLDIEGQVLTVHCFLRKDERHFRLDRIQAIHIHSGEVIDEDDLE